MAEITKQALQVSNNTSFPNNNAGAITPSDLRAFNVNMIDSLVDEIGYNADSASWNISINALNTFTSSQQPSFTALNQFTASQLVINSGVNSFTQSATGRLNNLEAYTASFTTSVGIYDENVFVNNVNQINFSGNGITASYVSGKGVVSVDFTQLNASTASQQISIDSLNNNSASVNVSITNINSTTASLNTSASLSLITASVSGQTMTFTKGNGTTFNVTLPTGSGGGGTTDTGSLLLTASFDNGTRNLTFTKGDASTFNVNIPDASGSAGDFVTTSSFNAYTASTDSSISQLNASSASQQISIDALNTNSASVNTSITNVNSATASLFTSVNNINTFTQSAQISINALNAATSSYVTSAITASSLVTASFSGNTLTFTKGDASTFGVVIPDVSGSTIDTGSFATTGSNAFIGNQTIAGGLVVSSSTEPFSFSGSSFIVDTTAGGPIVGGEISFRPGTSINFQGNTNFTGPIRTTVVNVDNLANNGYYGFNAEVDGRIYQDFSGSVNSRINAIVTGTGFATTGSNTFTGNQNIEGSLTASLQEGYVWAGGAGNISTLVATSSFGGGGSIDTGSFATTGSNTFVGNQTINADLNVSGSSNVGFINVADAGGINFACTGSGPVTSYGMVTNPSNGDLVLNNNPGNGRLMTFGQADARAQIWGGLYLNGSEGGGGVVMNTFSGSLFLTPSGLTSTTASLLHITSSSPVNNVNLIFKSNNIAADTIVSGSGNIFTNPTAAASAGFKRYMGGSGNINLAGVLPIITGSMAFSPVMNNNYSNGNLFQMLGPVSSSTYNINGNVLLGTVGLGTSATVHVKGLTSGLTMTSNQIASQFIINANQASLTGSTTTVNTNIINGTTTLNLSSSAVNFTSNTANDVGFSLINQSFSSSMGLGSVNVIANTIGGNGNVFRITGSIQSGTNTAGAINQNLVYGGANILLSDLSIGRVSGTTAYHQIIRTSVLGNNLIVTGSSLVTDLSTVGSTFVGRYNAQDGARNRTAETVFAVGTGDSTTRKTGFLIDSGSNTFIEGTLNVSGSTSLTGSLTTFGDVTLTAATAKLELVSATSIFKANNLTGSWGQTNDVGGNALKLDGSLTIQSGSAFFANGNRQFNVGAFSSLVTQSGSAGVSQSVNFEVTDISEGVSVVSNSRITLANSGTYSITFSAQLKEIGGTDSIYLWLKKNGTNVDNTGTKTVVRNNDENIMTVEYIVQSSASDYYEIVFQNVNGHAQLYYEAASGNIPATPSIIITVKQVR
jgi:hypothetical protein